MGRTRLISIAALLAAGSLALAGCGSDSNGGGSGDSSSPVTTNTSSTTGGGGGGDCASGKLTADGSTAQQNAIEQFVYAYVRACPGYTLDYNANGSGAGVTEFVNNQTDLAGSDVPLDPSTGQNDRAIAFLRSRLRRLRQLETANSHSDDGLTRRGTLVNNGTIERLRLPAAEDVLLGKQEVRLREDAKPVRSARRRRDSQLVTGASLGIEAYEQPLWDALRALRTQLARQQGVPPYVVFHDATLLAMLRAMPANEDELAQVSGVGEAKLKRYGRDFLAVINAAE